MLVPGEKRCLPAGRVPQAQALPAGFWFSVEARSQVHCPAGRARHEQRGPSTAFSEVALSQVQCRADCLPQEQVACLAEAGSVSWLSKNKKEKEKSAWCCNVKMQKFKNGIQEQDPWAWLQEPESGSSGEKVKDKKGPGDGYARRDLCQN